ncbi:hypothetical protein A2U01_0062654, partial [Trifolium medium]|nr:hypothetical protein [Trifolium medium]
ELKGLLLNYLLSSSQEQELLEAKNKMAVIDTNLASIEEKYTVTKEKLSKEIEALKASQKVKIEKLQKDHDGKLDKVKDSYATSEKKLKENAASQAELISKLTKERDDDVSGLEALGQ